MWKRITQNICFHIPLFIYIPNTTFYIFAAAVAATLLNTRTHIFKWMAIKRTSVYNCARCDGGE